MSVARSALCTLQPALRTTQLLFAVIIFYSNAIIIIHRQRRRQHAVAFNIGGATAIVLAHSYCHLQYQPHACNCAYAWVSFSPQALLS
jgi:hypothetical protein